MPDKEEFRPFNMNLSTVGRFGGAGLLGGSSAAAALVLIKMLKDMNDDHKKNDETDDNTIVLTLPAKKAEDDCSCGADLAQVQGAVVPPGHDIKPVKSKVKAENRSMVKDKKPKVRKEHEHVQHKAATTPTQIRSHNGVYSVKTANWQTLAASLAALGLGGGMGFSLVNKIYEKRREKELEGQLSAAKQEYLDTISKTGSVKAAGLFGGTAKGDPSFSMLDYPFGIGALALLLGGGSTAWLTKRILDQYNKDPESKYKPQSQPRIDRIVFRTEGGGSGGAVTDGEGFESLVDKTAAYDDGSRESMEAMLGVYLDICSGSSDIVGDVKCAAVMEPLGLTPSGMYKMADEDYDRLMMYFKMNPELRSTMKRLTMEKHPLLKYLKWGVNLPLIRQFTDQKLYENLERQYGPNQDLWAAVRNGQDVPIKTAMSMPGLAGGMMAGGAGATLAELAMGDRNERIQEPDAVESDDERKARVEDMVRKIDVGAADPEAAKFVQENSDKLRNILLLLAEEGRI